MTLDPGGLMVHDHHLPSDVRNGDLIVVSVELYDAEPFSIPSGFVHVATITGGDLYRPKTIMFRRWASTGDTTVTIPFLTVTGKSSSVAVYRGVDQRSPIVGMSSIFNDGGQAVTVPGVTAAAGSKLVMVVGACSNSTPGVWTGTPTGMTRQAVESVQWNGMVFYDQSVQAGPTGSRTAVRNDPTHQSAIMVALRAAGA
jgi:hypothetical protein